MKHPDMMSANGKARFNEMIASAEAYRRVKRLKGDQIGLYARALQIIGDGLVSIHNRIKVQPTTEAELPAMNE